MTPIKVIPEHRIDLIVITCILYSVLNKFLKKITHYSAFTKYNCKGMKSTLTLHTYRQLETCVCGFFNQLERNVRICRRFRTLIEKKGIIPYLNIFVGLKVFAGLSAIAIAFAGFKKYVEEGE